MGIMSGNPQDEPMHYGEVFDVWSFLLGAQGKVATYQTMINHTGDQELRKFLENVVQHTLKPSIEQLEDVLKANGVALPPAPPERAKADLNSIPAGARMNDPEIAAAVSMDIAASLVACSQAIGKCIREDIALMFGQFHMKKAKDAAIMLRINKEKGWLVPPPLHLEGKKVEALV